MSQQVEGNIRTFVAAAAIMQYQRVKLAAAGQIDVAGVADKAIGIAQTNIASGASGPVALLGSLRTFKMIANAAIMQSANVYPGASGKIAPTGTGSKCGQALEAADADGDVIEVLTPAEGLDASDLNNSPTAGLVGYVPFIIDVLFADGATADVSIPAQEYKYRVIDAFVENQAANGANANTVQVCAAAAGASPITDAMSLNGKAANDLVRAATIQTANATIAANTAAFMRRTKAGGTMGGVVRVVAQRVA